MTSTTKFGTMVAMLLAVGCSRTNDSSTADSGDDASLGDDAGDDAGIPPGYPSGPYGVTVGKTLDPTLEWQGFAPGATTQSIVKITDLYDPDGSKGINAIVVDSAGQWCVACQGIALQIPTWLSSNGDKWTKLGVKILNLVIQNNDYLPATVTTAQQWRTQWNLTSIYVVADPNDTFPTSSLPYELLIDPRTMQVVDDLSTDPSNSLGADGSDPKVTQLATKNGG